MVGEGGGVIERGFLQISAQRGGAYCGGGLIERGLNRAFTVFAIIFLHLTLKSFTYY